MTRKFLTHLEAWRRRPEAVRQRARFLTAAGLTLVLSLFWLLNFKLAGPLTPLTRPIETAAVRPATSQAVDSRLAEAVRRIKNGWRLLLEQVKS